MAIQLAFDSASIDGTSITASSFVRGGTYSADPNNGEVFTADGKMHGIPLYRGGTASFQVFGDQLALTTPAADGSTELGNGVTCSISSGAQQIVTGTALVTCSYDEATRSTTIELKYDPSVDAS